MHSYLKHFLVLRGSEIKPNSSLTSLKKSKHKAHEQEITTHSKLEGVKLATEAIEKNTSNFTQSNDLKLLIKQLHDRIDLLEEKERKAKQLQQETDEKYNRTIKQLACGGLAGAVARTTVAPIDRVKILRQTQFVSFAKDNLNKPKYRGIIQTLSTILKEEGIARLWRGNGTNMFRIVPYAAAQFTSYDIYKSLILHDRISSGEINPELRTHERLLAGALAGTTATTFTHPLDVIRLRLNVQPELKGAMDALRSVLAENGIRTLFKGYIPTVVSLSPFIAINFTSFDILKKTIYPDPHAKKNHFVVLGLGAVAGIFAQTCCYPLDTVRRRMQMKGKVYNGTIDAFKTIAKKEGLGGFYKGMTANAVKVIPNNAIRFLAFEFF